MRYTIKYSVNLLSVYNIQVIVVNPLTAHAGYIRVFVIY